MEFVFLRLGITIFQIFFVSGVNVGNSSRMLDRTPVLLGSGRNLLNVAGKAVKIAAIEAVDLFNDIQVGQSVAVDHDIIAPFHLGDAINRKTCGLKG